MTALNRLPIVVIAICEAVMIYTATGVAKVAFTQLDAQCTPHGTASVSWP